MTPQDIFDYKMRWRPGFAVALHSDLDIEGKSWCRRNLEPQQWSFTPWTDVYEHTFYFENIYAAQNFEMEFHTWSRSLKNES